METRKRRREPERTGTAKHRPGPEWAALAAECAVRALMSAVLAAGNVLDGCAPFSLGYLAASGAGAGGFCALMGAIVGYVLSKPLVDAFRYAATAILIYAVAFAFYDLKIYATRFFMPLSAALMGALTGFVYLAEQGWQLAGIISFATELALTAFSARFFALWMSRDAAPEQRDLAALLCGRMEQVELREGENPLEFRICGLDEQGHMAELPYQNLLLFTPLHPEAEHPYGVSLLRGLPFMADILMKIYHTVGVNWERCGNVRFAVTCRDGGGSAAERGQILAQEWSRAMQDTRSGSVRDFVAVGDVDIKVIGGDAPILDSQVPVRQVMEQIVAKTSIPPFMLGLNWNSTERMSAQQADMLTTEITAIRRTLTPVVEQICRMWLRMQGYARAFRVDWDDINLQDEVEEAKAELYREQARKLRIENDAAER